MHVQFKAQFPYDIFTAEKTVMFRPRERSWSSKVPYYAPSLCFYSRTAHEKLHHASAGPQFLL